MATLAIDVTLAAIGGAAEFGVVAGILFATVCGFKMPKPQEENYAQRYIVVNVLAEMKKSS